MLGPQNTDPSPEPCLLIRRQAAAAATDLQVSIWAWWPNDPHHLCILPAPQGPGLGFEVRGFLFVCLRMFYSFILNRIQLSSLLRLWLSAILK